MMQNQNHSDSGKLGYWMSTALVVGTMIGSGIFLLPSSLALYGGISLFGWIVTSAGALLLALTFSTLSRLVPKTGGPFIYTKEAFGDFMGFLIGWGHWISYITGGAAIAVAFVGYLAVFIPSLAINQLIAGLTALVLIWIIIWINISGVRNSGIFQVITTILKLIPLLLVTLIGFAYFNADHFRPFNQSGSSSFSAISATATMTMWAFIGLETVAVALENVKDPERNVRRATISGTLIVSTVYILGTIAVLGILPGSELAKSTAPFADAATKILGPGAGYIIAFAAVVSCIGALNGLIFCQGQLPFSMAREKLFPPAFKKLGKHATPVNSLIISGIFVTAFMSLNYARTIVELFTYIILLSTLTTLLPFAFASMAKVMLISQRRFQLNPGFVRRAVIIGSLAFIYAVWAIAGSGQNTVFWGFLLLLLGIPVYVVIKWKYGE